MRQEEEHKGYQIIGDVRNGKAQAVILSSGKPVGPRRFEADTVDAALAEAKAWVDASRGQTAQARRSPNIATAAEYEEYFRSVELADHERSMLAAHAANTILTAGKLSDAVGWQDYRGANRYYGELGMKIAKHFGLTPLSGNHADNVWTTVLAEGQEGEGGEFYRWTIHPEVVEGLAAAGVISRPTVASIIGKVFPDPFDTANPNIWLTSMWGFDALNWGFVGFTNEADRKWLLDQISPGCLLAVYVTDDSKRAPALHGKLAGFLQLNEQIGFAKDFMPGDAYARIEANSEESGRWNYAIGASRAWQIVDGAQPRIDLIAPETVGPSSGPGNMRQLIGRRGVRFAASEIANIRELPVIEVPCFGGRRTFNTTPQPLVRSVQTSSAVPRSSEPYTVQEDDGPKHLYMLQLDGDLSHFLGRPAAAVHSLSIIKVGYSGEPTARCYAFNKALPACAFHWHLLRIEDGNPPWANWKVAQVGEDAMKYQLQRLDAEPLGGEFFLATSGQIEHAWMRGRNAAMAANGIVISHPDLSLQEIAQRLRTA
ncbi:hypothetical protein IMCC20628_03577 [Hoeflea sp. IMCC20628]|uniref:hypothetical protein n=1 Tax=Hoeflea sp. IMCC20628 TaxID=1620421 RepID=UPI00063BDBBE|nr:hypothetical protein [Hoeflea sp. IMCC20628]AKI02264.1 hypothetical protein IMCC20628_03577 [Hoeflea sp. IMCC20628]